MRTNAEKTNIVIIGAGIIGLTAAVTIQDSLPRDHYSITIVAIRWPTDTSCVAYPTTLAGAHYRPIPASTPQLAQEAELAHITYQKFKLHATKHPELGIKFVKNFDFVSGAAVKNYEEFPQGYQDSVDEFHLLNETEKPPGVEFAASYQTWCVDPVVFGCHLLRRFKLNGGLLVSQRLLAAEEAFEVAPNVSVVVNCSGFGFGDPDVQIVRGQTCLVANECDVGITQQNADGSWTFLIPRPLGGGTIVGGTKEPGDWTSTPSPVLREIILDKAAKMYPEILNKDGKFDVIQDIVGRRPMRQGGLKLERQAVSRQRTIVHAYGAGGRGWELSWGIAQKVASMVEKSLRPELSSRL